MRKELEDSYNIIRLQNCILNIAYYIHHFCEEYNIKYCLMGGSALGAVRHKGFIPWDDDLDIFMRPDDYEKFRELFNTKGDKDNFYLQEWGAKNGMVTYAKLRMNNTTLIEKHLANWDIHHGVYVDIFILHTCPDNKIKRINQYVWAKYIVTKSLADKDSKMSGLKGIIINFCKLLPKRFIFKYALTQVYKYRNEESRYLCHFMGRALLKTGLYERKYFDKVKKVPFESVELYVPYYVKEYLTDRWGDFMRIPPYEETLKYHHSWKWSDVNAFDGYKASGQYVDEPYL